MNINVHATTEDYAHALTIHNSWAAILMKQASVRQHIYRFLWMLFYVAFILVAVVSDSLGVRRWALSAGSVLVLASIYPAAMLGLAMQLYVKNKSKVKQTPTGIIEAGVGPKGNLSPAPKNFAVIGWIFFAALAAFFFVILQRAPLRTTRIALPTTGPLPAFIATSDPALSRESIPVPGAVVFFCSLFASIGAVFLVGKLQRAYQLKAMLESQPTLLLPKRWEFSEEGLTESSDGCTSSMKWSYIRKFFESPRLIMLYTSDHSFFLIPRAAFKDELTFSRLLGLVMSKVPNGVIQARPALGFAITPLPVIPIPQPPPLPVTNAVQDPPAQ